jgi:rhodanese-related sulfurtransferase
VLSLVGLAAAFGYNAVRNDGIPLGHYEPATSCSSPEAARPEVGWVSPQALAVQCGNGDTVVADVRSVERFAMGHIAGAIHLPCGASDDAARVVDSLLHGKRDLVVYGDAETDARPVAEALARRSEPKIRVRVLRGGFEAWANQGLACASGGCACPEQEHP